MAFKTPEQIAVAAVASGEKKAHLPVSKMLAGGFLAGACIAFAGLLAVDVTAGLKPELWGGVTTLLTGAVFSLGLVLVIIAGSELLTGNMALIPIAVLSRRVTIGRLAVNWGVVLGANLLGALFVAYVLAVQTGVIGAEGTASYARIAAIATGKAVTEDDLTIFLRAIGCNWLVCLGVWMALAAEDVAGKVLAIFFPITAFVALGFDHVVANMFFLPAAHWAGVPGIGWGHIVNNWVFAGLGNVVGGGFFVGVLYWFLYLRGREAD
ncbi:formate/nitrite transporter family protein [Kineococcus endophyticus]|uniref:Formate/nitrite transporter family protein n=1 Tax=Kineococcus endophyticus TaxID=1181883 RepID=A0ABV3P7D9_9ACTN